MNHTSPEQLNGLSSIIEQLSQETIHYLKHQFSLPIEQIENATLYSALNYEEVKNITPTELSDFLIYLTQNSVVCDLVKLNLFSKQKDSEKLISYYVDIDVIDGDYTHQVVLYNKFFDASFANHLYPDNADEYRFRWFQEILVRTAVISHFVSENRVLELTDYLVQELTQLILQDSSTSEVNNEGEIELDMLNQERIKFDSQEDDLLFQDDNNFNLEEQEDWAVDEDKVEDSEAAEIELDRVHSLVTELYKLTSSTENRQKLKGLKGDIFELEMTLDEDETNVYPVVIELQLKVLSLSMDTKEEQEIQIELAKDLIQIIHQ